MLLGQRYNHLLFKMQDKNSLPNSKKFGILFVLILIFKWYTNNYVSYMRLNNLTQMQKVLDFGIFYLIHSVSAYFDR